MEKRKIYCFDSLSLDELFELRPSLVLIKASNARGRSNMQHTMQMHLLFQTTIAMLTKLLPNQKAQKTATEQANI